MPIYRQQTHRLRLHYADGPHLESERPRHRESGRFLDEDAPTFVELTGEEVGFDRDAWLRSGGGALHEAPLPAYYRLTTRSGVTLHLPPGGGMAAAAVAPAAPARPIRRSVRRG